MKFTCDWGECRGQNTTESGVFVGRVHHFRDSAATVGWGCGLLSISYDHDESQARKYAVLRSIENETECDGKDFMLHFVCAQLFLLL